MGGLTKRLGELVAVDSGPLTLPGRDCPAPRDYRAAWGDCHHSAGYVPRRCHPDPARQGQWHLGIIREPGHFLKMPVLVVVPRLLVWLFGSWAEVSLGPFCAGKYRGTRDLRWWLADIAEGANTTACPRRGVRPYLERMLRTQTNSLRYAEGGEHDSLSPQGSSPLHGTDAADAN